MKFICFNITTLPRGQGCLPQGDKLHVSHSLPASVLFVFLFVFQVGLLHVTLAGLELNVLGLKILAAMSSSLPCSVNQEMALTLGPLERAGTV